MRTGWCTSGCSAFLLSTFGNDATVGFWVSSRTSRRSGSRPTPQPGGLFFGKIPCEHGAGRPLRPAGFRPLFAPTGTLPWVATPWPRAAAGVVFIATVVKERSRAQAGTQASAQAGLGRVDGQRALNGRIDGFFALGGRRDSCLHDAPFSLFSFERLWANAKGAAIVATRNTSRRGKPLGNAFSAFYTL